MDMPLMSDEIVNGCVDDCDHCPYAVDSNAEPADSTYCTLFDEWV